jgi:uncharacterized damage-inducible protein DinB
MRSDLELVLRHSFDGDSWHGPSLAQALADVDARAALARPVPGAHGIWELTHHLMAWTREVTRRLHAEDAGMPDVGNWREAPDDTDPAALDAAWARLRASLDEARDALLAALGTLTDEQLDGRVRELLLDGSPGPKVTRRLMLIGLAEHNAYHGGQIVLLKRALEADTAPPPRDPAAITES